MSNTIWNPILNYNRKRKQLIKVVAYFVAVLIAVPFITTFVSRGQVDTFMCGAFSAVALTNFIIGIVELKIFLRL
jgi:hypothetical protein